MLPVTRFHDAVDSDSGNIFTRKGAVVRDVPHAGEAIKRGAPVCTLVCVGAGVPLIVIGSKKEPVEPSATATISPWATRNAAGLGLRIEL